MWTYSKAITSLKERKFKNIKIEDIHIIKKTIENLQIYGCHSDNHVLTKTRSGFCQTFDPKQISVENFDLPL